MKGSVVTTESKSNGLGKIFKLLPWLVVFQTSILVAGIPWAFGVQRDIAVVHEDVAVVKSKMEDFAPAAELASRKEFTDLLERVVRCETKIEIRKER